MIDYASILDDKTKRRVLLDRYEDQKNMIRDYLEEHNDAGDVKEAVSMMEKLVETLDIFCRENLKNETEA